MNLIAVQGNTDITVSSRKIAEKTGKDHGHVMRDIRKMLETLEKDPSKFGSIYQDAYGRPQDEFLLDFELALTLVAGYDVILRNKVVNYMIELETEKQKAAINLPTTYIGALEQLIEKEKQRLVLENKLAEQKPKVMFAEAVMTKADDLCLTDAGKHFGWKSRDFIGLLSINKHIYQRNLPSGKKTSWIPADGMVKAGFMRFTEVECPDGRFRKQTLITASGLAWCQALIDSVQKKAA